MRPSWEAKWVCGALGMVMLFPAAMRGAQPRDIDGISAAQSHPAQNDDSGVVGDKPGEEPDEPLSPPTALARKSGGVGTAWEMIQNAAKSSKPQLRIDALGAVGTLGDFPNAEEIVETAMTDGDRDVRLAAAVGAGTMNDRRLIPFLRRALDDKAPEVSYSAAVALWKLHDHSGEAILYQVLAGERKAAEGFIGSEMHQANKDLHSPSTLALLGAEQGAYAVLGPFGIGLDAAKMMMKGSNANSARVLTATLLSTDDTTLTKRQFLAALRDKDYFVRAASARALGNYRGKDVTDALQVTFADKKPSVRLTAAASYIRVNRGSGNTPRRRNNGHSPRSTAAPTG